MAEGPLGGPRPLADSNVEIVVYVERNEPFGMDVEDLEQELRDLFNQGSNRIARPDVVVDETYRGRDGNEKVDKILSFIVKFNSNEFPYILLTRSVELIEQNFPVDYKRSQFIA